jgi:hypothetical protein
LAPEGADGDAPAVALRFDPQTLQKRASFGRLVPHFGQFIMIISFKGAANRQFAVASSTRAMDSQYT